MKIHEYLKRNRLVMDGAMGTYYAQKYARRGEPSEIGNFDAPAQVKAIHMEYIRNGARLIRTNTFASNSQALKAAGYGGESHNPKEVVRKNLTWGFNLAREAVNACGHPVFIAADIGPISENGAVEEQELLEEYIHMAQTFIGLGAEIIMFETFSDLKYIIPVARYIKDHSDIFVMTSFCLNKFGYTKSGISAAKLLEMAGDESSIDTVGFNCGVGAAHMYQILKKLDLGSKQISIVPNSGYPDIIRDRSIYQENVEYFTGKMQEIADLGVNIIGGCCGTTPEYTKKLSESIDLSSPAMDLRRHFENDENYVNLTNIKKRVAAAKAANPLMASLHGGKKPIVVELDPPYNADMDKIIQALQAFKGQPVDMVTLSDSPMGKMRADSMMVGAKVQRELDFPVMPHVACRDRNQIAMGAAFLGAHLSGIRNLLVVTGDPVQAGDRQVTSAVYDFNSVTLMEYIQQMNEEYFAKDPMVYGGALNYGRKNIDKEIERMERKIEAGASYFLTQPLFSVNDIERITYIKSKVKTKIFGGIMPLVSYRNALFMKNEIYGIHVPDAVLARYTPEMSRQEGEAVGIACALELIDQMKDVVDGYYFMVPFNRAEMICRIIARMDRGAVGDVTERTDDIVGY